MRDDPFPVTFSSTLARLREAMRPHPQSPAAGTSRSPALDATPSLTERHLRILGVGQSPDRAEAGGPFPGW